MRKGKGGVDDLNRTGELVGDVVTGYVAVGGVVWRFCMAVLYGGFWWAIFDEDFLMAVLYGGLVFFFVVFFFCRFCLAVLYGSFW